MEDRYGDPKMILFALKYFVFCFLVPTLMSSLLWWPYLKRKDD